MTVSWVLPVSSFDRRFQSQVFERLPAFSIDIFAIDTQRFRDGCFVGGLANYLDFFWLCMLSVSSPMIRFNSSFSRLSLL